MNRFGIDILFLFLLLSLRTSGQEQATPEAGLPLIQNFPPRVIQGAAQNWDIVQDRMGMIYVANGEGILQYDGQEWRVIPAPHGSWVYALGTDSEGTVYFGGEGTFGYLAPDSSGTFKSISLVSEVPQADAEFGRIRNVLTTREGIFFQSFSRLFRWSEHGMQIWKSRTAFLEAFVVNGEVYVLQQKVGLMKMGEDQLELLPEGEKLAGISLSGILPYRNENPDRKETLLIATPANGLFLYDQYSYSLRPFPTEIDRYLEEDRIQSAALLSGDLYAFGTLKNGIFILDRQGRISAHFNKRSGLLSDDVKSIKTDWEGGLWLALQTGVSRVDYPSPLSFFDRQLGLAGSIGSILRHHNTLYAGSSQGILYLDDQSGKGTSPSDNVPFSAGFLPVSGVSASCWNLLEANRILLAATEDGLYQISGSEASFLPDPSGEKLFSFSLYHSRSDTNQVFAGIRNGLVSLKYDGKKWVNEGIILNVRGPVHAVVEDDNGNLWLETRQDRVFRVTFEGPGFRNPKVVTFGPEAGLPKGREVNLVYQDSRLFAYSPTQILSFEEAQRRFTPDSTFNISFSEGASRYSPIVNGRRGKVWLEVNDQKLRAALKDEAGDYRWMNKPFANIQTGIWSVFPDSDGSLWFGGDDILFHYRAGFEKNDRVRFPCLLRRIISLNSNELIFGGDLANFPQGKEMIFPFEKNAIRFEYAVTSFATPSFNQFRYFLEGFDKDWSQWSEETVKEYTNLREGAYTFRVRARDFYGEESEEAAFSINLSAPWYRTWWSYFLYGLAFFSIFYGLRRYELARLHLKNRLKIEQLEGGKLRELDQLKSQFFTNISHEFRTPLALILGPVEKILEETREGNTRDQLHYVKRNARRLQRLIDQLLDLSRLESGKMELRVASDDIVVFLKGLTMGFASLSGRRQITLEFQSKEEEIELFFDRDKMEKIVSNLISNAIKFTPDGGKVTVFVQIAKEGCPEVSAAECLQITISDTGIGIPEEQLPHIFERFYQVPLSSSESGERWTSSPFGGGRLGVGIGLALTKELVALHKGNMTASSKKGQGTTFTIRLPLGKAHLKPEEIIATSVTAFPAGPQEVPEPDQIEYDKTTDAGKPEKVAINAENVILLVEDHADFRAFLRAYLEPEYKVIEAIDGEEGLESAVENIPDLIISDVMMPKMNGFQLSNALKQDDRTSHIPVILLTARVDQENKVEGLEFGADDYLGKPFDAKELLARIKNLIEGRRRLRERFAKQVVLQPSEIAITSADELFLQNAIKTVEDHIDDEQFNVEKLQVKLGMSRTQLHRKLKALTNQSTTEFIRSIRLHRAADLLKQKAGSVAEIAYMVGFNSQSYFTQCFQQQFGMSPKAFAKRNNPG